MALLIQYFKKGFAVVARNLKRLLCRIKVVIFQLIIKITHGHTNNGGTQCIYFTQVLWCKKQAIGTITF